MRLQYRFIVHSGLFQTVGFLIILFSFSASAYPPEYRANTSASSVYFNCTQVDGSDLARGLCTGFIEGVYNTIQPWCVPGAITRKELETVIVLGLKRYVDRDVGDAPAAEAIVAIVVSEWPCG